MSTNPTIALLQSEADRLEDVIEEANNDLNQLHVRRTALARVVAESISDRVAHLDAIEQLKANSKEDVKEIP